MNDPVNNINARVIAIQKADGVDVGPTWWEVNVTQKVGNGADEQTMFQAFMTAYERDFPKDERGVRKKRAGAA